MELSTIPAGSALQADEIARMEGSQGWRRDRVEFFDTSAGRVVVKGHRPRRPPTRHRAQSAIARLVGLPFLRAVPVHGGAHSQAVEIQRLQALGQAGLPVPRVLHVAPDYFVMTSLGSEQLSNLLARSHPDSLALWRDGGQALVQTHLAGQYLSQCFGRNMIVDDGQQPARFVGMIDFEDDPLEVMDLPQAQVHDWLIYLQSTLWHLPATAAQVDQALDAFMDAEDPAVRTLFDQACRRLSWLRHLPESRALGRDTMALQAVAAAGHRWNLRRRA